MNESHPNTANTEKQTGPNGVASACRRLSIVMRNALARYDLRPLGYLLANLMVLESFDRDRTVGRLEIEEWSRAMGLRDAKGLRVDKCKTELRYLAELGIALLNWTEKSFQLRPDHSQWSRECAFRREPSGGRATDLPLRAERPLDEALAEVSRERALDGVSAKFADGTDRAPSVSANFSETAAHIHDHDREVHDPQSMKHVNMPHAARLSGLGRVYDVGEAGRKTGHEILAFVVQQAERLGGKLSADYREKWARRIVDDAEPGLCWRIAAEAKCRNDARSLENPAGWMNRWYMSEKRLGPYA
ncbi:MAG: hypothetical protein KGL39_27865 [Patescibacteria group bacterium]|nr:hypothetical protein [Patescibacteria group bacterium]